LVNLLQLEVKRTLKKYTKIMKYLGFRFDHFITVIISVIRWHEQQRNFAADEMKMTKKLPSHTAAPKHQAPQARGPEYGPLSLLPKAGSGIMC